MQPTIKEPRLNKDKWVYATLRVRDGDRLLKPSHVCFDHVSFDEPPSLTSRQVEIILTNGDAEQRQMAEVLAHNANDTWIPIRLLATADLETDRRL